MVAKRWRFRPEWLEPLDKISADDLGQYRHWLECQLGLMTVDHREQAKRMLRAVRDECSRRRLLRRASRRAETAVS